MVECVSNTDSGGNTIALVIVQWSILRITGKCWFNFCDIANFRNKDGTAILRIRGISIGIGTDTPARTLHLHDDDSDTVQLHITNATTERTSEEIFFRKR